MTNHTPTPWEISEYEQVMAGSETVLVSGFALPTGPCKLPHAIGRDNAAHIVKCVNLHDALVNALKAARNKAERINEDDDDAYNLSCDIVNILDRTLELVEGAK